LEKEKKERPVVDAVVGCLGAITCFFTTVGKVTATAATSAAAVTVAVP